MTKPVTIYQVRAALLRSLDAGPGAFDPRLANIFPAAVDRERLIQFASQTMERAGPKRVSLESDPVAMAVYVFSLAITQGIQIGLDAAGASLPMD